MSAKAWLADVSWEMVVWQNEQLCIPKHAHHGPTSDGHADCRKFWEKSRMLTMTLDEMVEICRKCHRMAPFTNYNGNTFSAIARIDRQIATTGQHRSIGPQPGGAHRGGCRQ